MSTILTFPINRPPFDPPLAAKVLGVQMRDSIRCSATAIKSSYALFRFSFKACQYSPKKNNGSELSFQSILGILFGPYLQPDATWVRIHHLHVKTTQCRCLLLETSNENVLMNCFKRRTSPNVCLKIDSATFKPCQSRCSYVVRTKRNFKS